MTVTLDLSPEVSARAQAQAARQEVPLTEYLARIVADVVAENEHVAQQQGSSPAVEPAVEPAEAARRERALALLGTLDQIGDEQEQQETFAYLKTAVNQDRLSDRDRF